MKPYLLLLLALIAVGLLNYHYSFVSFLLIGIIGLSVAVLLVVGLIKIFNKQRNGRWLKIPFMAVVICLVGIVIGWLRPLESATIDTVDVSKALAHAYATDQGDRKNLKFYLGLFRNTMKVRDSLRLDQVNRLHKAQLIEKPLDKFHAAFVFHHSRESQLYEIAYALASEAASAVHLKDNYLVQWLIKAAYDRWMLSIGKLQKYGTQGKISVGVD